MTSLLSSVRSRSISSIRLPTGVAAHGLSLSPIRPLRPLAFSTNRPAMTSVPAAFYRGGTSKGLVFSTADLPASRADRDAIFLSAMGSPDPNGRQLDGMGGGYSSVSKVIIVGPSEHPEADVDYTFAQVLVDRPVVDYGSNCGNMLAAVGPFALERGLVSGSNAGGCSKSATVRILNTNTNKLVHATFPMSTSDKGAAVPNLRGDFAIDGVSGTHARVVLDFLGPEGSRTGTLFPTGQNVEDLQLGDGSSVRATLMDCGNPCVFVRAEDVGLGETPSVLPNELTGTPTLARLDNIRNAAAVAMKLVPDLEAARAARAVPKVCVVSAPHDSKVLSGQVLPAADLDLVVRCISSGDPHRALPITAALCTAAGAQVPGTLVAECARRRDGGGGIVIGHASGTIEVDADLVERDGALHVPKARVFRTARKLFEGQVFA